MSSIHIITNIVDDVNMFGAKVKCGIEVKIFKLRLEVPISQINEYFCRHELTCLELELHLHLIPRN